MAELSPKLPQSGQEAIPPWRDIRVLGVLAQIIFVIAVILAAAWLFNNVTQNLESLGENQFLCRDGSTDLRCAYDFLSLDASFDISESMISYDPSDSYSRALLVGALNTVKVIVFGVIIATILGTVAGIARLSSNWLVNNVAKWYVDIMRNTPLLLQLFFLYFGGILLFPQISEAIQLFGLPVYLSQRGVNMPWLVFMPSFATWAAFLVLGLVQAQVLWMILGRQAEVTGHENNRTIWAILSFLVVAGLGWYISGNSADNQAMMVPEELRIREFHDLGDVMERRLEINDLSLLETAIANGDITQETLDTAAYKICSVTDSSSEVNLTAQLRGAGIPYTVDRSSRLDRATETYAAGECDIFVATKATLAAERDVLEDQATHMVIPLAETPVRLSVPRIEGLNFVGGTKLTPNFAAILLGLILYTGAFIAEIVRAGIQSVPKGQSEAARALGLNESQRLRLVVLPQALRVIIPPITSQYLNLAKNSTLAIAVGYDDLWRIAFTTLNQSGRPIQVFILVMGSYLLFSLLISALLNWYNQKISLVER